MLHFDCFRNEYVSDLRGDTKAVHMFAAYSAAGGTAEQHYMTMTSLAQMQAMVFLN
jgi:hypothetical protein